MKEVENDKWPILVNIVSYYLHWDWYRDEDEMIE